MAYERKELVLGRIRLLDWALLIQPLANDIEWFKIYPKNDEKSSKQFDKEIDVLQIAHPAMCSLFIV